MKRQVSPEAGIAQVKDQTPLGEYCSEIKPRPRTESYYLGTVEAWDEEKWQREARARSMFAQYLQHDVTFEK